MFFPTDKYYICSIKLQYDNAVSRFFGKEEVRLIFAQGILWEYFDFCSMDTIQRSSWIMDWISKHIEEEYYIPYVAVQEELILSLIKDKYFKWWFVKENKSDNKKTMPFFAYYYTICKESNISPIDMLKVSVEQFMIISESVIYNLRSQTKDWQKENDREYRNTKSSLSPEKVAQLEKMREQHNRRFEEQKKTTPWYMG